MWPVFCEHCAITGNLKTHVIKHSTQVRALGKNVNKRLRQNWRQYLQMSTENRTPMESDDLRNYKTVTDDGKVIEKSLTGFCFIYLQILCNVLSCFLWYVSVIALSRGRARLSSHLTSHIDWSTVELQKIKDHRQKVSLPNK